MSVPTDAIFIADAALGFSSFTAFDILMLQGDLQSLIHLGRRAHNTLGQFSVTKGDPFSTFNMTIFVSTFSCIWDP